MKQMIEDAKEIEEYCNSFYASDREALYKAEQFKQKYGRTWTGVIDESKAINKRRKNRNKCS